MPRNRLLLVLVLGLISGLGGGLTTVLLPENLLLPGSVYVVFSFVPAILASRWSSAELIEIWGLLATGTAIGMFASVAIHPTYRGGERNLWPFEVVIFLGVGLPPGWGGLLLGRRLTNRDLPSSGCT
jgi:hypothetical protein